MTSVYLKLRTAPPFIIGAGLLLWGWQNDFLVYSLCMAFLLECKHLTNQRWSISDKEFNQISDLSSVIFLVVSVYLFNEHGARGIFNILSAAPFIFFLLITAQTYSVSGKIKLSALFMSMRKAEAGKPAEAVAGMDFSYPFFIICLVSASVGNHDSGLFFLCSCLLLAFILWSFRPRRYRFASWICALLIALFMGYMGQLGILETQRAFSRSMMQLFEQFIWRYRDPKRTTTAIGSIGRLKLSDRIIVRAASEKQLQLPLYLREATYNNYGFGVWSSAQPAFETVQQERERNVWNIHPHDADQSAVISSYLIRDTGVIPIPHGATRIKDIAAIELQQTALNTLSMEIHDGWIKYGVDYKTAAIFDSRPLKSDFYLPKPERETFYRLSNQLALAGRTDEEKISTIKTFFAKGFYYSLSQEYRSPKGRYLSKFLFETKTGHCEYFATATALLLRAAGIPSRYAVGYVVGEYSPVEKQYIARARHAHSWVLAYVDDRWQLIDTTPSIWYEFEKQQASVLQPLWDVWSWFTYRFSLWRSRDALEEEDDRILLVLLIPLIALLVWRLYFKQRISVNGKKEKVHEIKRSGLDSHFYTIVDRLERSGFNRHPGETLFQWITRYAHKYQDEKMLEVLNIHYRYRFDPEADGISLKQAIRKLTDEILLREHPIRTEP